MASTLCLFAIVGCALGCDGAPAAPPTGTSPAGLAVVSSDGTVTDVSLVTADGRLTEESCASTRTSVGGAFAVPLSGDVTLPSQPQRGGALWLVDRAAATLTIVDPETCVARAQWAVGTGFAAQPHDVAVVSDAKVYVTRYETNAAPADANAAGDDLLILDRNSGAVTGRISLTASASTVAGATLQARPDRMVLAEGRVLVTLANADAKLQAVGVGRVAVVDPATDTVVSTVDLAGLKGCSALFPLAGTKLVFVSCGGSMADPDPTKSSGLVMFDLATSPPTIDNLTTADAFGGQPLNPSWVAALSQSRGFVATQGTPADPANGVPATMDALFSFDLMNMTASPLALHAGSFTLGRAAVSATMLFVPDATAGTPLIHVLDVPEVGAPTERAAFHPDPVQKLPPREIAWY